MKKTMILAAAAAMFMAASCQKEEAVPVQDSQADELVFTATIVDQTTKTTVNTDASSASKGKVSWEVNDEISVSDGTNAAVYYIAKDGDISATDGSATFTYKSGTRPSAEASSYTASYGDAITAVQTYSATAGKLPMTGSSDSGDKTKLNFTVTCGLLKLNLAALGSESDQTISKIEVVGRLADASKDTLFTLNCSDESIESSKDFFIALPAGDYTIMKLTNGTGNICFKKAGTAMSIAANKIQPVTLSGLTFSALLPGEFSVSATKQVRFTRGNLYYSTTDGKYHIESAQNVTYATLGQSAYDSTHVCHFFWSNITDWQTSGKEPWAKSYSCSAQSASDKFFCGADNQMTVDGQSGLYALTGGYDGEWEYLFFSRTNASNLYKLGVSVETSAGTVANCAVIAPDDWDYTNNPLKESYSAAEWATAESSGLVCLPAAGNRNGSSLRLAGSYGYYWSATPREDYEGTRTAWTSLAAMSARRTTTAATTAALSGWSARFPINFCFSDQKKQAKKRTRFSASAAFPQKACSALKIQAICANAQTPSPFRSPFRCLFSANNVLIVCSACHECNELPLYDGISVSDIHRVEDTSYPCCKVGGGIARGKHYCLRILDEPASGDCPPFRLLQFTASGFHPKATQCIRL